MLRKSMKDQIIKEKKLREQEIGPRTKTLDERVREHRIRKTATKDIQDLTFLLENLPEEQLERIFNKENLASFLRILFKLRYKSEMSETELEKRRKRILEISYDHLTNLGDLTNAWGLAYTPMKILMSAGVSSNPVIIGVEAIFIQSIGIEKEKEI